MLDVGFSELLVFGIIALLVLGPEKLPEAARFAARCYSKFKTLISNVQNDIDRELHLSELREQMNAEMNRIQALEQKMQAQMQELQQQTIQAAEQQQQHAATDNKNSSFIYHYILEKPTTLLIGDARIRSAQIATAALKGFVTAPSVDTALSPEFSPPTLESTATSSADLDPQHSDQKVSNYKVAV